MRKIVASEFITLDGVVEAPGPGDNTLPDKKGWVMPYTNDEVGGFIVSQMDASDAMLLGRRTYQDFAAFWPQAPADDPFGGRMNNQTKYVVSNTLDKAEWTNTTLINGDIPAELTNLKQQPGKDIAVTGSPGLVRSLLQYNLLDELILLLCPVVLGVGKRLFYESSETKVLELVDSKTISSGMIILTYRPASK